MKHKTSKIKISDLNKDKHECLSLFIDEYAKATLFFIDYLWNNGIVYFTGKGNDRKKKVFDIKNDLLDCPQFISTKNINFNSLLSERALKCASTQACGIVKAHIDKRRKLLYVLNTVSSEHKRTRNLTRKINKIQLVKPDVKYIEPCLNTICAKVSKSDIEHFDHVLTLSSIGKSFGKIIIPFNYNTHTIKLENKGTIVSGLMISKTNIKLVFEIKVKEAKKSGIIVGADQGINTVITLSDHQKTPKNQHGHDLNYILRKISGKKKGSKGFYKALYERNNYINWSINQLNFDNIKQINLEKLSNFRYKKNVGKFLNYFAEPLIREKLIDVAFERGVRVQEQSSPFRSQRCSHCGYVNKKNRKGKDFSCKRCSFQTDADLNASLNHEVDLPFSNVLFASLRKIKEFFWTREGFFYLDGSELTVPDTSNSSARNVPMNKRNI